MIINLKAGWIGSRRGMLATLAIWLLAGGAALGQAPGTPSRSPTTRPEGGIRRAPRTPNESFRYRAPGTTQPFGRGSRERPPLPVQPPDVNPPTEANVPVEVRPPIEVKREAATIEVVDEAQLEALKAAAAASTQPAESPPTVAPLGQPAQPVPGEPQPTPAVDATPMIVPEPGEAPESPSEGVPDGVEFAEPETPPEAPVEVHEAAPPAGPATATRPAGTPATPVRPAPAGAHGARPGALTGAPATIPARPSPFPPRPGTSLTKPPAPSPTPAPHTTTPPTATHSPKADEVMVPFDTKTGKATINPKTLWKIPYNERPYFFSWNNTPLEKCCQDFVEMSGLSMLGLETVSDGDKKIPITFQSLELQTFDQALTRFDLICQEVGMGYWILVREGYLEIRQLSEWYRRMSPDRMYDSLEAYKAAKLPDWEMASTMYAPIHQPAQYLAQAVNDHIVDNCVRATLVPRSNLIQLRGAVHHIERSLEILGKYDVLRDDQREWVTYELKYLTPAEANSQLQYMLQAEGLMGGASAGPTPTPTPTPPTIPGRPPRPTTVTPRPPAGPVDIGSTSSDEVDILESLAGSSLTIRASKTKHKRIAEIIAKIDTPTKTTIEPKTIELQYVDPSTMIEMVNPLLGERRMVQPPAPPARPGAPPTPPPPPTVMQVNTSATMQPIGQNRILVKANPKEMAEIEKLIKMLDVPPEEAKYQVVRLQHAEASSVAMVLTSIITGRAAAPSRSFRPGMPSPSSGGAEGFKAIADTTTDRTLVLSGSKQDIAEAQNLIKELDVDPALGADEHIVQLKSADPSAVVQILTTRFGGSSSGGGRSRFGYNPYYGGGGGQTLPQFIPDDESRMLVVICHDTVWPDINKLITELDEKQETLKTTRSYLIKHSSAESIAMLLGQALGSSSSGYSPYRYRSSSGGQGREPSFLYNDKTNLLLVTATEEDHVKAADLIEQLDQPSPADKAEFRAIDLEKADAEYVAEKIEELFGGEGSSSRRRSYRSSYDYYSFGSSSSEGAPKVPVRVIPEPIGNRVLVQASDEDFEKAKVLAQEIDAQYTKQDIVRKTFILENTDAWDAQQIISAMFEAESSGSRSRYDSYSYPSSGGRSSSSSSPGSVKIAPMGNGLVVQAPKAKMDEIEKFIKEIDTNPAAGNEVKMYRVKNTGYEGTRGIASNLSAMLGIPDSSSRYGPSSGTKSPIKIMGDYGSNILFVSAPKDKMPEIDKKVQEFLTAQGGGDMTMILKHFAVTKARPQEVADMVQPILDTKYREMQEQSGGRRSYGYPFGYGGSSGGPQVTVNKLTRKLMVMAPAELMDTVEQLIKEFDTEGQATVTRTIQLITGKAEEIAPIVQDHMKASGGSGSSRSRSYRSWDSGSFFSPWGGFGSSSSRSQGGEEDLTVTAFEAANSIILRGTEDKVFEAEQFIKMLDAGARPDYPIIKVCQLKYADPYTVADYIEEVAAGGSSSSSDDMFSGSGSTRKISSSRGAATISVKPDYATKRLIVAAPADKWPLINEIIEIQEKIAFEDTRIAEKMGEDVIQGKGGTIKKFYTVEGPAKEIAARLDDILYGLYGYSAPYVKYFSYTNQVVIDGDPKYFKAAEEWLNKLVKNPPPVKMVVSAKRLAVSSEEAISQLQRLAPASLTTPVNIRRVQTGGKTRDPMDIIKEREIKYDTPIEEYPVSTRPAAIEPVKQSSPFVPSGVLARIEGSLAQVPLAQVTRVVAKNPTTEPAAATTQPAAAPKAEPKPAPAAPIPDTRPAATPVSPKPSVTPAGPAEPTVTPAAPERPVVVQAPSDLNAPKAQPVAPKGADAAELPADDQTTEDERLMAEVYQAAMEGRASKQPQIIYDDTGHIIIIGDEAQVREIEELLDTISDELKDLGALTRVDIRVIPVQYIDVTVAATMLESLFNEPQVKAPKPAKPAERPKTPAKPGEKNGKAGTGAEEEEGPAAERRRAEEEEAEAAKKTEAAEAAALGNIKVLPDPRINALVIKAAPETFPKIAEVLLKIDRPGPPKEQNIRIFQLKKLNAAEVEEVLKEILKIETPRQQRTFRPRIPGRSSQGGIDVDMIEAMEQQMLEFQQSMIASNAPAAEGEGKNGKTKINPAKEISIASNATTNSIIVTASREGMELVGTLIKKLEEQDIPIAIKTVDLENAEAEKVATQLEKVFETTQRRSSSSGMFRGGDGYTPSRMGDFKVSADSRTNRLVVRALETDMEQILTIVKELDSTPSNPVEVYAVEKASAEDLAKTLTEIYGTQGGVTGAQMVRITADRGTNSLLVRAPKPQQVLIAAKIKDLEQQSTILGEIRQIQLKVATPSTVAAQLTQIFTPKGSTRGTRQQVNISGDDASKMLFVTCPKEMFEEIKRIAEQMDQQTEQIVQVYPLDHAAAPEVLAKLKEMAAQVIPKLGGSAGADTVFAVSADERTNAVIAAGTPKALLAVEAVVKKLDIPPSDKTQTVTKMFPLNRGNAASVAATITQLYGSKRWQSGVEAPKASPDPTANVVFVTGTASQLELIDNSIIKPLEGYTQVKTIEVAVNDYEITVNYADVEELANKLTTMFTQRIQARKAAGDTSLSALDTAMSIVPEPSTRKLFLSCSKQSKELIDNWLKGLDVEAASFEGQQTKVLPVRFADLTYMANALNTAFTKTGKVPPSEQVKIVPEYGTNSIIVKALKKDMDKIEKLLTDIDRDDRDRLVVPESIQVQHVLPSQMASRLTPMIRATYAVDRRTGQYPVSVEANDTAGTILVSAKSKQAMDSIKELITKLDSRPAEDERSIKPYVLQFADLASTMNIIMKRFGKQELLPLREQVAIEIDYTTGALLVTASEARHAEVTKIIGDVDNSEVVSIKLPETIKVNNVLPTQLASRLNTMIQQSKRRDRRTGLFPVTVTPDDNAGTLLVTANKADMQETKELIAKLDVPPEKDPRTVKAFVIKYADPTSMQNIILKRYKGQELRPLKDQVAIEFDYSTSSMLVTGSEENQAEVAKILTEMDNPSIVDIKVPETIKVEHVRASQLATTLTQMIQATKRRDKRTGLFPVTVNGDDNANTLLITANKLDMEEMKRLIEQLDIPMDTSDDRIMKVYPVKFADPSVAKQIITDQFKGAENRPLKDQVTAGYDYATSTVMVTASEDNHKKVQTLIDTFDKSDVAARKTYPVELRNGDPEDAAQTLTTLYANAFPRTRTGRMPAVFTAVPGSRKLLVTCTPGEFEEAKVLIEQLDVGAQTGDQKRAMRVVSVKRLPAREVMQMMTEYLRKPGKSGSRDPSLQDDIKVTASDTADAVVLTGPEDRLDELQQLIEKVDASVPDSDDPARGGRQLAVIPLTNADPSSVAQVIMQTYQPRGNVPESEKVSAAAERATNSLVISASPEKMAAIQKMIADLDQTSANVPQQEIVRLKNARAEELVTVLEQTYRTGRRGMGSGPPITFAADSNGNAVIVSAGKADMEGIKIMIADLDKPATENVQAFRIIPLQYVDAEETLTIMTEYLRKSGVPTGRRGVGSDLIGGIRIQASPTLNALIVSGSEEELDRVQKIALDMDKQVEGAGAPKIVKIEKANASALAQTLKELFVDPAGRRSGRRTSSEDVPVIMADQATNSLVIRARPMDYTLIADMIKQLDQPSDGATGIEVIAVSRGMDVVNLARQIQDVINAGERAKRTSQQGYTPREVAITGESRSSTLIVSGSPEMFDTVRKLAADLDTKRGDVGTRRAVVIPVKTKSPQDIQKVLDQFIELQTGKKR